VFIFAAASMSDMSATVDGDGVVVGFVLSVNNEDSEKERLYAGYRVGKGG
jgi:hypothetical protein